MTQAWLDWAREMQAMSQIGLTYCANAYDEQRYRRLAEIAAEIVEHVADLPKQATLASFARQGGYATPKVDVRGAVVQAGKILLVREHDDGSWAMPGGWADVGEYPSEMVAREVREECGVEVIPRKLIGVFDSNRVGEPLAFYHAYKLVFLCDFVAGELIAGDGTSDARFFAFDDLPPLSEDRTNARHLREVQAHLADADRPAHFD